MFTVTGVQAFSLPDFFGDFKGKMGFSVPFPAKREDNLGGFPGPNKVFYLFAGSGKNIFEFPEDPFSATPEPPPPPGLRDFFRRRGGFDIRFY